MISKIIARIKLEVFLFWYRRRGPLIKQASYMGCQILVRANEDVGILILANRFEKGDLSYILSKTRDDDIFFDIGANVGLFSLAIAKHNKTIKVHAFEPIPLNASLFETSLHLNLLESVQINQTCLGDREGYIEFSVADDSAYSSILATGRKSEIRKLNVPITTLDKYLDMNSLGHIDIIKMDVEGAENLVLDGAKEIFNNASSKPRLVMMELLDDHLKLFNTSIDYIVDLMKQYGYHAFFYENDVKSIFESKHFNKMHNIFFEIANDDELKSCR